MNSISDNALQAFGAGQQVTAHNVANLNTDDFKASRVIFQENGIGGVKATVSATQDSVDISREAIALLANTKGFKANLAVVKAADDMSKELLNIKA